MYLLEGGARGGWRRESVRGGIREGVGEKLEQNWRKKRKIKVFLCDYLGYFKDKKEVQPSKKFDFILSSHTRPNFRLKGPYPYRGEFQMLIPGKPRNY